LPEGARFLVRFRGDVDGLKPGDAVRIRGFRIGTVRDVRVTFDSATNALDVPVVIDVVPDLLVVDGTTSRNDAAVRKAVATLVERGLRAQLRGGVLGNTHVALDLIEGAEPATLRMGGDYPEIPAGPARGEQMTKAAEALLKRVETLPIEQLADDMQKTAVALRTTAEELRPELKRLVGESEQTLGAVRTALSGPEIAMMIKDLTATTQQIRLIAQNLQGESKSVMKNLSDATQAAARAADQATVVIAGMDSTIGKKSPIWSDLTSLLDELNGTTRSLRLLLTYLERHPDALIRGKSEPTP
jgi:paraquat-inducible protein B